MNENTLDTILGQLVEDYCKSAKEDVVIWLADHPEAKQQLTQMVKEIIGEDDKLTEGWPEVVENTLRKEQRARARKYGLKIES